MRNLADISSLHCDYVKYNVIVDLCNLLEINKTDGDLMLNVARIFRSVNCISWVSEA